MLSDQCENGWHADCHRHIVDDCRCFCHPAEDIAAVTTKTVRDAYVGDRADWMKERIGVEFDRWLAQHDAIVAAEALESAAREHTRGYGRRDATGTPAPTPTSTLLTTKASRFRKRARTV